MFSYYMLQKDVFKTKHVFTIPKQGAHKGT